VIAVILIPLTLLTLLVAKEIGQMAKNIQGGLRPLLDPHSPIIGRIMGWLGRYVSIDQVSAQEYLIEQLNNIGGAIAGRTLGLVGGVLGAVIQTFFAVFTMYYLFRDGDRIYDAMLDMIPLEAAQTRTIFDRAHEVIHASIYGVITIAGVQGTLGGVAFAVLGLPSALVWGVVMFFLSMIPLVGSSVVWLPTAIYLALSGHWGKALALALWGALVIGTIDNFLRPKLIGVRTGLHELLIFFSVLGGVRIWGPLGLALGPVVVAITLALLDILRSADSENRRPRVSSPGGER
jgi:predicted PurR-regulated permease PerM